jgi:hypothetical protein
MLRVVAETFRRCLHSRQPDIACSAEGPGARVVVRVGQTFRTDILDGVESDMGVPSARTLTPADVLRN